MPFIYRYYVVIVLFFLGISGYAPASTPPVSTVQTAAFIAFSDIHFNPFASCKSHNCPIAKRLISSSYTDWPQIFQQYGNKNPSKYGKDSNYALLKSTLAELKKTAEATHPQFVLIGGDFLTHKFQKKYKNYSGQGSRDYKNFVKKIMRFLTFEIQQTFPKIPVYPAIGNNDSYHGDYYTGVNGSFLRDTANIWMGFFVNSSNQQKFLHEFTNAGYYAITPKNEPNLRIIMLNSVLFSPHSKPNSNSRAATVQLGWLGQQLSLAKQHQQSVLIMMHIPAGIATYYSVKHKRIHSYWHQNKSNNSYINTFLGLIKQNSAIIKAIIVGHAHRDAFQLIPGQSGTTIVSWLPAISPIYHNNPGFKVFYYNTSNFDLINYTTYYLPLMSGGQPQWSKAYEFNQVYQPGCKNCLVKSGMSNIKLTGPLADAYKEYYDMKNTANQFINQHWKNCFCAIKNLLSSTYKTCISP